MELSDRLKLTRLVKGVMKGTVIPKCYKKKWNADLTMETNRTHVSRSDLQVDEDVHFVLEDNEFTFSTSTPNDRNIELSRKTYSKKNPIVQHSHVIFNKAPERFKNEISIRNIASTSFDLKNTMMPSGNKTLLRKRKKDAGSLNSNCSLSKKLLKKNLLLKCKSASQNTITKVPRQPRSKSVDSLLVNNDGSDSEVEVVAVIKKGESEQNSNNSSMKKFSNIHNNMSNRKTNKSFENEAKKQMLVNEADKAPSMPTYPNLFPDAPNRANSVRWLNANGTISVPGYSQGFSQNSPKPQERCEKGNAQTENRDVLLLPEMKMTHEKRPKGKRELKGLYENLNEISWAHETSFKNLLRSPDYIRHSERSTGRIAGTGKNLRKLKPHENTKGKRGKCHTAANILARKKSKIARLNHTQKEKKGIRNNLISENKKKVAKPAAISEKKKSAAKSKSSTMEQSSTDEEDVRYKLACPLPKAKVCAIKAKIESKVKNMDGSKLKLDPLKMNSDAQKMKSNVYKVKSEGSKTKIDVVKMKSYVPHIKPDDSPPSTSGLQSGILNNKNIPLSKSSDLKNFIKKVNKFAPYEMQLFQKMLEGNEDFYSAVQKGSKLRVRLQPLEYTELWNAEFYEEFRKRILDQAFRQAIESRDYNSVQSLYQDMMDSMQVQQKVNNNNNRLPKRRRFEDENVRTSIRQSEGAFKYKEIVVKKQKNYLQVVLVPSDIRQNCLTVEAMKELKDAFLLAKKDSNCRAVLLNSSGSYFCTGVDLSPLVGSNKKQAAEELANSINELVLTLSMFTKPVVAAVNGAVLGFGVSLLTYCDVVLASDKATFCLPAAKIGYIPEGGITLTLPQVVGSSVATEMFLQGRRLTAEQALRCGLVSEVLWPTSLMNEVMPRLENIISQPLQVMETTKAMVRCHLWDKLKQHIEFERTLLVEHWQTRECQENIKQVLANGWIAD